MRLDAIPCCHRKATEPVTFGRDEIGKAGIGPALALGDLLAQERKARQFLGAVVASKDQHIIVFTPRRPDGDNTARPQPGFIDDLPEHLLRIGEQVGGTFANDFIGQDRRIIAGQFPCLEKRRPVDVGDEIRYRHIIDGLHPGKGRAHRRVGDEIRGIGIGTRRSDADQFRLFVAGTLDADILIFGRRGAHEFSLQRVADQRPRHADRAAGIEDMDDRAIIGRRDAQRGVDAAGRRPADKKRHGHARSLHFGRDRHHLVQ